MALSTLRQLGIIIVAIGLKLPLLALTHLIAHAFFKALLFIIAGNLIHVFNSYQDFREFGGGNAVLPLRERLAMAAQINLIGLPFLSAYFSKEPILEFLVSPTMGIRRTRILLRGFIIVGFYISACLTVIYSTRFLFKVFIFPRKINNLSLLGDFPEAYG